MNAPTNQPIADPATADVEGVESPPVEPQDIIRDKILHTLRIFPRISPSMLQVGIGTSLAPAMWHPILEKLIADNLVSRTTVQAQSPMNRQQVYTVLSLCEA